MSWPLVNINDICRPKQWKTVSSSKLLEEGYPVYGANGRIGYYSEYTHEFPTLMITCRGATCGNVHISVPKAYINGNAMALDGLDSEKYSIKYLFYYFKSRGFNDVISGSAQPQITRQGLSKIEIPLPPLPVQKQIAAVLEKADTLRSQCQQMEQELNSLAQSVFLDMFGDPTQTTLSKLKLSECLSKMESGWSPNCESFAAAAGRPGILKLGAVTSGVYLEKENKAMIDGSEPKKALEVKSGDLLFTRKNTFDLVAAVAYVRRTRSKLYIPDLIFRFVPIEDKPISKIYLWGLFSSVNFRKVVQSLATGAAGSMPNISKAKLLDLEIPFPPIELQEQYENRIVKIWELVATHEAKKKKVNEAFESVLQRAFKGELDLKDVA